jgi:large subunit ribosomal protein L37Ae
MATNRGTAARFCARGSNTLRAKVSEIEKKSRAKYRCPFCSKDQAVKRKAYGIWACRNCEKIFVGKAYTPY